jgi:hypothetical protein
VAGVSLAHHWVWTQDLFVVPRPRRVYTSEWPSPCTQPLPTYCQKHAKIVSTSSTCVRIMQHYFGRAYHAKNVQPQVGKTLKLCKNSATLFWTCITCQKRQHNLKLGKH